MSTSDNWKKLGQLLPGVPYKKRVARTSPYKSEHHNGDGELTDFFDLIRLWPSIVGPALAEKTLPLNIKYKSLCILTGHTGYSEQLALMEPILLKKIFEKRPALKSQFKSLKFQCKPREFESEAQRIRKHWEQDGQVEKKRSPIEKQSSIPHKFSPEYKQRVELAQEIIGGIDDADIEELFTSICLQHSKDQKE